VVKVTLHSRRNSEHCAFKPGVGRILSSPAGFRPAVWKIMHVRHHRTLLVAE